MGIKLVLRRAFNEAVRRYFQKIAKDYSCRLEKINDLTFHLVHSNYFINIEFFESHEPDIYVMIYPNRKIYKKLGRDWYTPDFIARALFSDFDFMPIKFENKFNVDVFLKRQSQLLIRYCDKMLRGDFSQWRILNRIFKTELKNKAHIEKKE